jgi:hypothetical protein
MFGSDKSTAGNGISGIWSNRFPVVLKYLVMNHTIYIYGTVLQDRDTLPTEPFSFVVDEYRQIDTPSFLIWLLRDTDGEALLCKIRRTTRPADIGMTIHVYDVVSIKLFAHGLINSTFPDLWKYGWTSRGLVSEQLLSRSLAPVPEDKGDLVKNAILRGNQGNVDESYFQFESNEWPSEVLVQANDALHAGLRIFGLKIPIHGPLREEQILDFDFESLFPKEDQKGTTPDGKRFFDHDGKRLYLHKVHRTPIEECLGVDLIYNFLMERRLVFIQYKCHGDDRKYYPSSDGSHDVELQRMEMIPGLPDCYNLSNDTVSEIRLCRCPVFVKLCKRELSESHMIPVGVYFSLCTWKSLLKNHRGLSVKDEPHVNNQQFQELVKNGLIGSTPSQSREIERHLVREADDHRLKLVFEETVE